MKKNYSKKILLPLGLLLSGMLTAQCPTISCPGTITVANDSAVCGAVVTFPAPSVSDPCASSTITFNYTGTIDTWTVPPGVTNIHIEARGAQGSFNTSSTIQPGMGAVMAGDFVVTPGSQLKILVGQQYTSTGGNGGGGGTFVTDMANAPIIIAGGGGGSSGGTDSPDKHGQAGTTGGTGAAGGGTGGTAGSGGNVGSSGFQSGAGGGLLTDGANGWTAGSGGYAFVNGGAGANVGFGIGGFGGGGNGSGYVVGGGGGGYSGGGSGGNSSSGVGGGGGSFNSGTNQVNQTGVNTGNGLVTISYSSSSSLVTTQTAGLASGSTFPVGTTTQTFVVDDGFGNTDTCSFAVIVNDTELPAISCPSNINVSADSAMCSAVVNFSAPNAIDNCSIITTVQSSGLPSGSAFPVGTSTVEFTTTDASGNSATCSFDITVSDAQAPAFVCPGNLAVNADSGMCSAVVNFSNPSATDNCNVTSVTQSSGPASGSSFPVGTTTVSFTATDSTGNSSTCSFDIIVTDAEAPALTCTMGTITTTADSGMCSAVVNFSSPSATDNCSSATVTQTAGLPSGSAFPVGTTTVTYSATDSAGNVSTCSFDVIVLDEEEPFISCPADVTSCSAEITGIAPSASDNCSSVSVTYTLTGATTGSGNNDASGNLFNVGTTVVAYTATDASGNVSTCSFNVIVLPLPVITTSATSTAPCATDAPVTLTGNPSGGTWSGTAVTGSSFSPSTAGVGVHTLTYSYTDANGCFNTGTINITVNACTGVNEVSEIGGLQVYPNPTSGLLTINTGAEYNSVTLSISQVNGQLVRQEKYSKPGTITMSLDDLASGMYMLTIEADGQVQTVKLVRN